MDLNENFVRLGRWPRNVSKRDLIQSAITLEDKCSHALCEVATFSAQTASTPPPQS
jgi:hypothetical protein